MASHSICKVTQDNLAEAVDVLKAAFFDDPGFCCAVPSVVHRERWLPVVFTESLRVTMGDGHVYLAVSDQDTVRIWNIKDGTLRDVIKILFIAPPNVL